jgi:hypothetical protein
MSEYDLSKAFTRIQIFHKNIDLHSFRIMDGLSVGSSTPARGPQDGPTVHHGLSFDVTITYFLYLSWVQGRNNFCVGCIGLR